MKTRLKKEFRNLVSHCLPASILIVGAAVLLRLDESGGGELVALLSLVVYSLGFSIVGSALFSLESNVGLRCSVMTFPVSRRRLYAERMLIGGVISVFFIGMFCVISGIMTTRIPLHYIVFYIPLCALGGGCFFALWLRETVAAFCATLLAPLLIICLIVLCWFFLDQGANEASIGIALVLYGLATQILAYCRYVGYEDDFLFDREINIFTFSKIDAARSSQERRHQPRSASPIFLIRKELRMQKFNFALAGATAVLFGLILFIMVGVQDPGQDTYALFGLLILLRMVWVFIPLSMGAVAISDERRWGILNWNQVQPIRYTHQLWIKAGVLILTACLLIGGGGVVLSRGLGMAVDHLDILDLQMAWSKLHLYNPHFLLTVPVMTVIGLYASSLSRGFLQSLIISISLIVLIFATSWAGGMLIPKLSMTPPIFLNLLLVCVLFGVSGILLSFYNTRASSVDGRRVRVNVMGLGGTALLSIGLTAFIYFRSWQLLIPVPSEVPIVDQTASSISIQSTTGFINILDAKGNMKALIPKVKRYDRTMGKPDRVEYTLTPLNWDKSKYPDLRWRVVGEGWSNAPAIASDGTLWKFQNPPRARGTRYGSVELGSKLPIVNRMSSETDWIQVSSGSNFALALRRDGTIWGWGNNRFGQLGVVFEEDQKWTHELIQVGYDNDWVSIGASWGTSCGVKQDGSLWVWGQYRDPDVRESINDVVKPTPFKVATIENCRKVFSASHLLIIEKKDESAWVFKGFIGEIAIRKPKQLELESGIRSVTTNFGSTALLVLNDGSLYEWSYDPFENSLRKSAETPKRVGLRNDWVSAIIFNGTYLGTTQGGVLWSWGPHLESPEHLVDRSSYSRMPLLTRMRNLMPHPHRPRPFLDIATGQRL